MEKIFIGLVGLGTVGGSVARILTDFQERIIQRSGVEICIKCAVVRRVEAYQGFDFKITQNLEEVLDDEEIQIVVELIGGVDYPYEIAKKVFAKKKAFVTANKAMLAYYAEELLVLSNGIPFGFEASVCGGIPVIEVLRDALVANNFYGFEGIFNGTSNFILTKMLEEGQDFSTALKKAQELGYAEADPTLDINGEDAGHKLLILAKLAYGISAKPKDILIEGIEGISLEDMQFAESLGYTIKLLGIAKKEDNEVDLRLHLALISQDKAMSYVNGVKNAINFRTDCTGDLFLSGYGAGGDATASAVISDLVHIARLRKVPHYPCPPFGFFKLNHSLSLKKIEKIQSEYYLRFCVKDHFGVLAEIASILADFGISVNEILQKSNQDRAVIFLTTHKTQEQNINNAIIEISKMQSLLDKPYKIRIQ